MKNDSSDLTDLRCGVGWTSLPKSDPMYWVCASHDLDYIQGGTEEDKKAADDNLEKGMEFVAEQQGTFWTRLEAWVLPTIARIGGALCWKPYSRMAEFLRQGKEEEK